MKRRAAHRGTQISRGAANRRKSARRDPALLREKRQQPGIRLMRRKASHRSARNTAARFHGGDDFFQSRNRRARERLAIKLHVEAAADSCGNLNRRRVLARATKEKIAKPVARAHRRSRFAANEKCADAVSEEPAKFPRNALRIQHTL